MNSLKQHIQSSLQSAAWVPIDSAAIACRDYETAVGTKRAFVYLLIRKYVT